MENFGVPDLLLRRSLSKYQGLTTLPQLSVPCDLADSKLFQKDLDVQPSSNVGHLERCQHVVQRLEDNSPPSVEPDKMFILLSAQFAFSSNEACCDPRSCGLLKEQQIRFKGVPFQENPLPDQIGFQIESTKSFGYPISIQRLPHISPPFSTHCLHRTRGKRGDLQRDDVESQMLPWTV